MRTNLFLLLILLVIPLKSIAHTEIVGNILFENFESELYAKITLNKRQLSIALMQEGNCSPKEMLKVCGNEYIQDHIKFKINGSSSGYKELWMNLSKNEVTYYYKIDASYTESETISVTSDYLLAYNTHAIMRVNFSLDKYHASYNINPVRQTIIAPLF